MKTFKEYLTERPSATERSAKAIEAALSMDGIRYKRKNNIYDVVFTLPGGYKIVTDGQMIDLKKGNKNIDSWGNRSGVSQQAVEKYQSITGKGINEATDDFLTKNQKEFLNSFKKLYNIDLFEFVEEWRTNKKLFTILTDDIPHNDLVNLERFCNDRGVKYEPNGRKALAIWV